MYIKCILTVIAALLVGNLYVQGKLHEQVVASKWRLEDIKLYVKYGLPDRSKGER